MENRKKFLAKEKKNKYKKPEFKKIKLTGLDKKIGITNLSGGGCCFSCACGGCS